MVFNRHKQQRKGSPDATTFTIPDLQVASTSTSQGIDYHGEDIQKAMGSCGTDKNKVSVPLSEALMEVKEEVIEDDTEVNLGSDSVVVKTEYFFEEENYAELDPELVSAEDGRAMKRESDSVPFYVSPKKHQPEDEVEGNDELLLHICSVTW